jgi:predicted nucleic acid-binding protein
VFLLDTNVLSELRRAHKANAHLAAWAETVPSGHMYISSVTILELETGALLLSRRDKTHGRFICEWIEDRVLTAFDDRILPVDTAVARKCATLHVPDPRPYRDSLIAATAMVHGLTVVTRNPADFEAMHARVLNPWNNVH